MGWVTGWGPMAGAVPDRAPTHEQGVRSLAGRNPSAYSQHTYRRQPRGLAEVRLTGLGTDKLCVGLKW